MFPDDMGYSDWVVLLLSTALAALILILGLVLFLPFFEPICWAIILALFFYPVYKRLLKLLKGLNGLCSLLMCILIVLFIIIPVFTLLGSVTSELIKVYHQVQTLIQNGGINFSPKSTNTTLVHKLIAWITSLVKAHQTTIEHLLNTVSKKMGDFFLKQGTVVFKNIASIIFKSALMLVTLYYFFRDGEKMLETFKQLLPLPPKLADNFMDITHDVLSATLYGNILTAVIQGGLGIFILWSLNFSAPFLWGMIMGIATFIPMVGTAIVWGPATLYLFSTGLYLKGAILLAFSLAIISQIDYFLRPYLISGKTQIHTLFLFFSILGGLNVFGMLGLVLGPLLLALCVSILEIYRKNFLKRI